MAIWIWTGLIAVIKLINIISGFVVQKRFVTVHSLANKITGAVLFVLPLTLSLIDVSYSAIFVCLVATFAAMQEGHIIRSQSDEIDRSVQTGQIKPRNVSCHSSLNLPTSPANASEISIFA